jgi:hypothetical protein
MLTWMPSFPSNEVISIKFHRCCCSFPKSSSRQSPRTMGHDHVVILTDNCSSFAEISLGQIDRVHIDLIISMHPSISGLMSWYPIGSKAMCKRCSTHRNLETSNCKKNFQRCCLEELKLCRNAVYNYYCLQQIPVPTNTSQHSSLRR